MRFWAVLAGCAATAVAIAYFVFQLTAAMVPGVRPHAWMGVAAGIAAAQLWRGME